MRTVLAAAAAGALIIGSAAGAMADTATPAVAPAPVVKIQKVDINRHSPINVDKARALKVRMTVRTPAVAAPGLTPTITAATVTLAQYSKKVGGILTPDSAITPIPLTAFTITPNADKTSYVLKGEVPAATFAALGTAMAPASPAIAEGKSALLCISTATTVDAANTWSTQTMKRLGMGSKKPVRECVKVFNPKAKPAKGNS